MNMIGSVPAVVMRKVSIVVPVTAISVFSASIQVITGKKKHYGNMIG